MGIPFAELRQVMENQLQNMFPLVSVPEMNPQMSMQFPMNTNFDILQGQPAANQQIGMQFPMNTNFGNLLGQPVANQMTGMQFPMITNFENLQGQSEANQLIGMQFPMNKNFDNLQGQPAANQPIGMQFPMNTNFENLQGKQAANQPIGMQFPMNTNFDNLQGQPVANQSIGMQFPMNTNFNNLQGQPAANQSIGMQFPMNKNFDNLQGQPATNQQIGMQFPMNTNFDNLQGQPAANQTIGMQLPMNTNFNNLLGQPAANQPIGMQFPMNANFNNVQGQPAASLLASEIYGGEHSTLPARDVNPNLQNLHADKLSLSKASSSNARDHNQFQQPISYKAHERTARDKSCMGRTSPLDSTQKATLPRAGQHDAGLEKGVNPMQLRGWPSTGADQMPSLSYPVLNSLVPGKNLHQSSFQGNTGNLDNLTHPMNDISDTYGQVIVPGRQTAEQQMTDQIKRTLAEKMMANMRKVKELHQKDQLMKQQQQQHEVMVPEKQTAQQQNTVPMKQASQQKTTVPTRQIAEKQKKKQSMQQQLHESNRLVINQMMVPGIQTTQQQSTVPTSQNLEQRTTVPGKQQQNDQLMQQHLNEMMATGRQIAAQQVMSPMQQTADPKMMVPVGQIEQEQQTEQQMQQQLNEMMVPGRQTSGQKMPAPSRHFAQQQQNDQMLQKKLHKMMMPERQTAEKQMMVPTRQTVEQNMTIPVRQIAEQQQKDQLTLQPPSEDENSRKRKSPPISQAEGNALGDKDLELEMPTDDDIESFFLHDDGNADNMNASLSNVQEHVKSTSIKDPHSSFTFEEAGFLNPNKGKILCCSFSTDGKILASAGVDKKVSLWNTKTFDNVYTGEEHSRLITDVRFKLNSSVFATSSFDKTVQIWDANKPDKSVYKLIGHAGPVTSVDFHPKNVDILTSCDTNDEIRLWNVKQCACVHILKGGSKQVRFQPRYGNYLAAASGNKIHLIDLETQVIQHVLEGHIKEVKAICWEPCGKYYASVSEDCARVWSTAFGSKCIHVLHSSPGVKFESCSFHPAYAQLMIIGCYQLLNVWNPTEKEKIMPLPDAHTGIISALTENSQIDMVGSASHDRCVKLWK